MREISVAIVSDDSSFARFFELECTIFGCEVSVFSKMPSDLASFDVIFADARGKSRAQIEDAGVIAVGAKGEDDAKENIPWPISLEQLQYILRQSCRNEATVNADSAQRTLVWQDRERGILRCGAKSVELSAYEKKLIEYLAVRVQTVVSREELNRLLGAQKGNMADVYVCHLRKKLSLLCEKTVIETVRGVGYRMRVSLQ